ncbi:SEC-C metal-binding domain-containing protein [Halalkalibacter akibai]|uniref:Zinc chelation protein SecC n=1 Tax=Halalkalibacter akibai (strain ATCC 43226 / DSM 21942 / CIP 109018 / JCM 9157 / 1139) TaxID=1236973 RepID=W4QT14_HALA3|nr:SEC-C metal-binding domain-containing protein [Halalkalibacter akibai]GAE35037.1 hypothetical protein JCM9157_2130 [Halalkalibacter akibai JCM 9157]
MSIIEELKKAGVDTEAITKELTKAQKHVNKKFWSPITVPLTLSQGLSRLTVDDLHTIRKRFMVANASSLKKAELISLIEEEIPNQLEQLFSMFDRDRYSLVKKVIQKGGYMKIPALEYKQIEYLRTSGILFTGTYNGEHVITIPTDLIDRLSYLEKDKEVQKTIAQNTEWIHLTHGMLFYYGALEFSTLLSLLEKYTTIESIREYIDVIHDSSDYYEEIEIDHNGFYHVEVPEPDKVLEEHEARPNLDYYPFTKQQLLKAGAPFFIDRDKSYQQFLQFLTRHFIMTKAEASDIVEECQDFVRSGSLPSEVMEILQGYLEFADMEEANQVMASLITFMNHTRQWDLKGHMPADISKTMKKTTEPIPSMQASVIDFQTKQKVGRNDPCPCGSGKKFKKCCG